MDNLMMMCMAAVMVVIILIFCKSWKKKMMRGRRRNQLPRGSLGWPLIGETLEFMSCAYSPCPERFMDKRRTMYGKVFKSHIFGSPTIVSTEAEVNRFILQSDASIFVPSYPKSLTELMGKSSILSINGSLQRRVHGLIGAFLKSPSLKAQITLDMQNYLKASMACWKDDQLIYIQDETKQMVFDVLVKELIGLQPGDEMQFLKQQFQEFIAGLISLPVKLPGTRLYRSLQASPFCIKTKPLFLAKKRMVMLVQNIIQEKRRNKGCNPRNVIDVLLNDATNQLTNDLISDNIIDLMIPGEDSVPMLMTLAIKYLSDCPLALQQLEEENMQLKRRKSLLGEDLCWTDYMSLAFTQNVIMETLRMGNIILGVMRKAMKDVVINGYFIPKGWCVFAYFRSVHLDRNHYDDPYSFNPWRWKDKDIAACSFTPFGGGQRLCPGLDLARLKASIFLHHMVTGFTWVAEEDHVVNFPTVRMKNKMPIKVARKKSSTGQGERSGCNTM
uniref:Cytochrome P450 90D2 n=1 Tax=Elaeis guineensis var. tenera TaxID=51953 RepID=A0A8N4IA04_ELAGV|nr:cytochrome P450 90D2-like [Elaeis guineensis]